MPCPTRSVRSSALTTPATPVQAATFPRRCRAATSWCSRKRTGRRPRSASDHQRVREGRRERSASADPRPRLQPGCRGVASSAIRRARSPIYGGSPMVRSRTFTGWTRRGRRDASPHSSQTFDSCTCLAVSTRPTRCCDGFWMTYGSKSSAPPDLPFRDLAHDPKTGELRTSRGRRHLARAHRRAS